MKHGFFRVFRIVAFAGLMLLFACRMIQAPGLRQFFFLALALLWFVPTLIWEKVRRKVGFSMLRHPAVFAAVDAYLVLMASAALLAGVWHRPMLLLDALVFLAAMSAGPMAGGAAALAGFFGLLNGWLLPGEDLQRATLLVGVGTALAALICGLAWRLSLPLLVKMLQPPNGQSASAASLPPLAERIAAMEIRLREMSAERDHAQEQLSDLEKQMFRPGDAPLPEHKPEVARPVAAVPVTDDPELKARLDQVMAALADSRAERAALLAEKQKLTVEIADLVKELTAVKASMAESAATATPAGDTHANG